MPGDGWCSKVFKSQYDIPVELAVEAIRRASARRVVVQLPDGLKPLGVALAKCLESLTGAEVLLHADSTFGACDLQYGQLEVTLNPDVIVHVGHSPYPAELAHDALEPRRARVVYLPARSRLPVPRDAVRDAAKMLAARGVRRVGVATTAQHVHKVRELIDMLEEEGLEVERPRGFQPYLSEGQVLGCDYRLPRASKAQGFVYLGGGIFHPLGLYLATLKPVVRVDPYTGRADDLTGEGEKLYRQRLYHVSRAIGARRWAIVVGVKTGQYRPWLVKRLAEAIEARGGEYVLIASEVTTLQQLVAIDDPWIEAFVVTSCPRLPTDDLWSYEKPVLTPGEAFMALEGRLEPYRFPW